MSGRPLPGVVDAPAPAPGEAVADAPAKVILLGEHAVNRGGRALVTAIGLRVRCHVRLRDDGVFTLVSGPHRATATRAELTTFAAAIDDARRRDDRAAVATAGAADFLNPARYVLAQLAGLLDLGGLDVRWENPLPVGCGLGSGAAAHGALAVAAAAACGRRLEPERVAALAWSGDVLAHGGIASALDASGSAYGGVVEYVLDAPVQRVAAPAPPALVVSDTGVVASTGAVNGALARRLATRPALAAGFGDIALLVERARHALAEGDLEALGRAMHLNQLVLARLGVSSAEIERLVDAALAAGAYGAKLSGSGRGGIVVAVAPDNALSAVAAAMTAAGGRTHVTSAAAPGARRLEPDTEGLPT